MKTLERIASVVLTTTGAAIVGTTLGTIAGITMVYHWWEDKTEEEVKESGRSKATNRCTSYHSSN